MYDPNGKEIENFGDFPECWTWHEKDKKFYAMKEVGKTEICITIRSKSDDSISGIEPYSGISHCFDSLNSILKFSLKEDEIKPLLLFYFINDMELLKLYPIEFNVQRINEKNKAEEIKLSHNPLQYRLLQCRAAKTWITLKYETGLSLKISDDSYGSSDGFEKCSVASCFEKIQKAIGEYLLALGEEKPSDIERGRISDVFKLAILFICRIPIDKSKYFGISSLELASQDTYKIEEQVDIESVSSSDESADKIDKPKTDIASPPQDNHAPKIESDTESLPRVNTDTHIPNTRIDDTKHGSKLPNSLDYSKDSARLPQSASADNKSALLHSQAQSVSILSAGDSQTPSNRPISATCSYLSICFSIFGALGLFLLIISILLTRKAKLIDARKPKPKQQKRKT